MKALFSLLLAAAVVCAGDYPDLLARVVKKDGVDYTALERERVVLDRYVRSLEKASAGASARAQIAFWINAYNALTLQQVLDTRPDRGRYSVQDVPGFWSKRKWTVAGRDVTLNDIEHKILREKFDEPRIHFAINCASRSCPPLSPELYRAETLDEALTQAVRAYLNDKEQNSFNDARLEAEISQLFEWFKMDFVEAVKEPRSRVPNLQLFLAAYVPKQSLAQRLRRSRWRIRYKKYDWSLNQAGVRPKEPDEGGSPLLWIYLVPTALLLLYGLNSLRVLMWRRRHGARYREELRAARATSALGRTVFPKVLVQLPTYNEQEVAGRVIEAVAHLDYPRDRLEVQILDDSTDETVELVDRVAARHPWMTVLRRAHRNGFKAGALAAGLARSDAEFVAIFDADFVPAPDFLRRALPLFGDSVACVQGRWAHLNRNQNWLTRAQAVGLDAHFYVVQFARSASGRFHNFMGTAGIWRRAAIDDAGGWSADTLTEDLDLSYRAQLKGWRILLDPDLAVPAEIPPTIGAYKSQQRRWACGSIQCARKHLPRIWRSGQPLYIKLEATMHLCGYGVGLAMAVLILLLPWLNFPALWPLGLAGIGPLAVTVTGQRGIHPLSIFFAFMLGVGGCMNMAVAVLRGLTRPIDTFVRTPKQGSSALGRTPAPLLEQVTAVFTLACVFYLAGKAPMAGAGYGFFCSTGFCALSAYWWMVERRRGEP